MKILLLSPSPERLFPIIDMYRDEILLFNDKIDSKFITDSGVDFLVSYNYRHLIDSSVLSLLNSRAINLHTSLLPYNKGAHPIFWSVLEETPLGVSIHLIDNGLDTGRLILQKSLDAANTSQTLRGLYQSVNQELVTLFHSNWKKIRSEEFEFVAQKQGGTLHKMKNASDVLPLFDQGWDTPIKVAKKLYLNYLISRGWKGRLCIH